LKTIIVLYGVLLSGMLLTAQSSSFFMPISEETPVQFQYKITNPSSVKVESREDKQVWYLDRVLTPCYYPSNISENGGNLRWNQIDAQFDLVNSKDGLLLEAIHTIDPFLNQSIQIRFEEDIILNNDASLFSVPTRYAFKSIIVYSHSNLPIQLQKFVPKDSYLKVKINTNIEYNLGENCTIYLPIDKYDAKIVRIKQELEVVDFLLSSDKSSWKKLNQDAEEVLAAWFKNKTYYYEQFLGINSNKEIALLEFDKAGSDVVIGGYYNLSESNTRMPKCNVATTNIYLYPNPSFGNFNIQIQAHIAGQYSFKVYNIIGQELYDIKFNSNGNDRIPLILESIKKGTYIYSIIDPNGDKIQTRRLIILSL